MVEQAMIFALGFLVAGVLMLMFLPAVWRRALRLSTRRLEMQMPLSMPEIVAERDQLRAEFAIGQRRIEQRLEELETRHAGDLAELGRRGTLIAALDGELADVRREIIGLEQNLEAARRDASEARAEAGATLKEMYDLGRLHAQRGEELRDLQDAHAALQDHSNQRRTMIASLETRVGGLEIHVDDLERDLQDRGRELAAEREQSRRLTEARDAALVDIGALQARGEAMQDRIDRQVQRIALLESSIEEAREALVESQAEITRQQHELGLAEERARVLRHSVERQTESAAAHDRDFVSRIEDLERQNADLRGALDAARSGFADLRLELANLRSSRAGYQDSSGGRDAVRATP